MPFPEKYGSSINLNIDNLQLNSIVSLKKIEIVAYP